jgi:hypothetical protein
VGHTTGGIDFRDVRTGKAIWRTDQLGPWAVTRLTWSADGRLVSVIAGPVFGVLDLAGRQSLCRVTKGMYPLDPCALAPGRKMLAWSANAVVHLYDYGAGMEIWHTKTEPIPKRGQDS